MPTNMRPWTQWYDIIEKDQEQAIECSMLTLKNAYILNYKTGHDNNNFMQLAQKLAEET